MKLFGLMLGSLLFTSSLGAGCDRPIGNAVVHLQNLKNIDVTDIKQPLQADYSRVQAPLANLRQSMAAKTQQYAVGRPLTYSIGGDYALYMPQIQQQRSEREGRTQEQYRKYGVVVQDGQKVVRPLIQNAVQQTYQQPLGNAAQVVRQPAQVAQQPQVVQVATPSQKPEVIQVTPPAPQQPQAQIAQFTQTFQQPAAQQQLAQQPQIHYAQTAQIPQASQTVQQPQIQPAQTTQISQAVQQPAQPQFAQQATQPQLAQQATQLAPSQSQAQPLQNVMTSYSTQSQDILPQSSISLSAQPPNTKLSPPNGGAPFSLAGVGVGIGGSNTFGFENGEATLGGTANAQGGTAVSSQGEAFAAGGSAYAEPGQNAEAFGETVVSNGQVVDDQPVYYEDQVPVGEATQDQIPEGMEPHAY